MVKRSRDQSADAPRRRIWLVMVEPDSSLPLPDALDERVAAEVVRASCLRRRAGSRTIFCVAMPAWSVPTCHSVSIAAHAVVADQRVHDRLLERVAHVQRAGDVRRRQQDAVRLALARWLERAAGFPARVPLRFDLGGFETLFHRGSRWRASGARGGMGRDGQLYGRGPDGPSDRRSPWRGNAEAVYSNSIPKRRTSSANSQKHTSVITTHASSVGQKPIRGSKRERQGTSAASVPRTRTCTRRGWRSLPAVGAPPTARSTPAR